MNSHLLSLGVVLAAAVLAVSSAFADAGAEAPAPSSPLDFKVKDIDGNDVDLASYKGKVLLIVNVASKCGNTPQYKPLEADFEKYKSQGFFVLGFPANNFGKQEPGTNPEIKEFCTMTYKVAFPMFAKISVKGSDIAPLYKFLTAQKTEPKAAGDVSWNFEKFLIGRDGSVVARFDPKLKPDDPKVIEAIEAELAKK